jgi:hypothetical protein
MMGRLFLLLLITGFYCLQSATAAPGAETAAPWAPICATIDQVASTERLPPAFLARVLWQESRFVKDATSPAGAAGVAQFMPATAIEVGLTDPRDPGQAIIAAGRLLGQLRARFGNIGLAAAAYNAGAGPVARWLRTNGLLPTETRAYVRRVTGHRVEEWAGSPVVYGDQTISCRRAVAEITTPAPLGAASLWQIRLDRMMAQARSQAAGRRSVRQFAALGAAEALCRRLRSVGLRCAVYPP